MNLVRNHSEVKNLQTVIQCPFCSSENYLLICRSLHPNITCILHICKHCTKIWQLSTRAAVDWIESEYAFTLEITRGAVHKLCYFRKGRL